MTHWWVCPHFLRQVRHNSCHIQNRRKSLRHQARPSRASSSLPPDGKKFRGQQSSDYSKDGKIMIMTHDFLLRPFLQIFATVHEMPLQKLFSTCDSHKAFLLRPQKPSLPSGSHARLRRLKEPAMSDKMDPTRMEETVQGRVACVLV